MEIIRSRVLGFCMGVRRAVEMAAGAARSGNGRRIFTLGPLIHNLRVLEDLKSLGVEVIDDPPQDLEKCSLIIRAHGIAPGLEEELKSRGAEIIDATCPNVKNSQLKVKSLVNEGYKLFLAGDARHAEIFALLGYAGDCPVVSNAGTAEKAAKDLYETDKDAKTALVAQTTISEKEYDSIASTIKKYFPNLEIVHTICSHTKDRQQALRELLDDVEAVIVVGGLGSANTSRLLSIAQESGLPCVQVENAGEIPTSFRSYGKVGISAGASTPDSVINEIEMEMLR